MIKAQAKNHAMKDCDTASAPHASIMATGIANAIQIRFIRKIVGLEGSLKLISVVI